MPAVTRIGDIDSCDCNMEEGSPNVFINSGSGGGALIDDNPTFDTPGIATPPEVNDPSDPTNPIGTTSPIPGTTSADVHIYEYNDVPEEIGPAPPGTVARTMNEIEEDQEPPPGDQPPTQDCSTVDSLPANFTWATGGGTFQDWANTFALSPNFTVLDLCWCAVGRHSFTADVNQAVGISQKEILLNMCHHAKTVLEPMLAKYGAFTITSGFRNRSGGSQHNKGQASDIQFLNFHSPSNTGDIYYRRAQEIRDDINYDQFILEWFGRNPWLHLSSTPSTHRHSTLTQVSSSSYAPGLKLLRRA